MASLKTQILVVTVPEVLPQLVTPFGHLFLLLSGDSKVCLNHKAFITVSNAEYE